MSTIDLPFRTSTMALDSGRAEHLSGLWLAGTCVVLLGALWFIDHDFSVMGRWEEKIGHTVENAAEIRSDAWAAGELGRRCAFPLAAAWGALVMWQLTAPRKSRWRSALAVIVIAYVVLCFGSVVWSDQPIATVKSLVTFSCVSLAALGIGMTLSPRQLCLLATLITSTLSLVPLLGEIAMGAFRPWDGEYRLSGTLHPNYLAAYTSIACIGSFCLWQYGRRAPLWAVNAMLMLGLTALTKSRMALAALLVSLIVVYIGRRSRSGLALAIAYLLTAVACGMLVIALTNRAAHREMYGLVVLNRTDEVQSLTGRTPLWTELLTYIAARPILGHGYTGFWTIGRHADIAGEIGWPASHAHSAYLGAALELGVVGSVIWAAIAILATTGAAWRFRRCPDPGYGFLLGVGTLVVLVSTTETMFFMVNGIALLRGPGLVMLALPDKEHLLP